MPRHGNHWETLCDAEAYVRERLTRDVREARLVCRADCVDVEGGTDRTEQVRCLRWGGDRLAHQILVVSNSALGRDTLFSGYPVVLDGAEFDVTVSDVEPWEYGIEGWVQGQVTPAAASVTFFDSMYFIGTAELRPGDRVRYRLAGLAYSLGPLKRPSFQVATGPLWADERQRRLDEGASPEQASRPVEVVMAGAAIFVPGQGDARDDAWFQGQIDALERFDHDGQAIYRLEMVLMRPGDEEFRLPVYASEYVLNGYVPRLGEDVEGELWVSGYRSGNAAE